jgi:uncharacterized GH25 family protein
MRLKVLLPLATIGLIATLAACTPSNDKPATQTADPVTITLTTQPDSPAVGDVLLSFLVVDQNGQPIDDATVNVTADHTDMSGMVMSGEATHQNNGVYAINTNFSMSGTWKITVQIQNSTLDFKKDMDLLIH